MARATEGERATSQGSAERGLIDYMRILWRHKLLIALTVLVTTGAAVGLDQVRHRTYQATAEVLFTPQGTSGATAPSDLTPADVATDIELVQSAPVQAAVAKTLHTAAPPVTVTEVGTTNVAQIAVQSPSPDFASQAANAYARSYLKVATQGYLNSQIAAVKLLNTQKLVLTEQINKLVDANPAEATSPQVAALESELGAVNTQLEQLQDTTTQEASAGQLVVPAVPDPVPISPKPVRDAVIAIGVGLLLGIGLALLRENLDDRVRSKDQLEQFMPGTPVLGLIPVIDEWRNRKRPFLVAQSHPRSPSSEAYRGLRTSVQFMALEKPTKVLQITSPSAGDGKTTTSANLAWIMADAGQRVVLIGCDLRQPRIHEFFGLPNDVGFTSVLLGEAELEDALIWVPNQPGLLMLPTGPVPPNPSELLSGARTQRVFKSLRAYADVIIVDSAPVLPVTDAAVLSTHAAAMLLVVSVGADKRSDVVQSVEMLNQINAPIAGIVLNRAPEADSSAYYHYGYGEKKSSDKGKPKDDKKRNASAPTNGNGNGKVVHDLSPGPLDAHVEFVKAVPAIEDEEVDWPTMGRHAKVEPPPLSGSPTLFPPQTGDAPPE
jgi:capsular exopolysaccharide synthesis family protein